MEQGKKSGALPAGSGELDYKTLFSLLSRKKPGIDILLENSVPATAHKTLAYLRELCY
jgi:hypothetical protein